MILDQRVTGKTKLLGLIGNPIEHTISPQLHNTISNSLGINTVYLPFRVENSDLESAVKGLKAINVIGFNVTIPYKKDVMKYLDENSRDSLLMGAVNTVKNVGGRLIGYNTDAEGFFRSFKESTGSVIKEKKVIILGAGGTARSIAVKVAIEGADRIVILNRTLERAKEIAEIVNHNLKPIVETYSYDDKMSIRAFEESDIIINTTSLGMHPEVEQCPLDDRFEYQPKQIVYDVIYNPAKTRLLQKAEEKGCTIANGLGMLFFQGINAYQIWMGMRLEDKLLKDLYNSFVEIMY